jgi:hypothetical protein
MRVSLRDQHEKIRIHLEIMERRILSHNRCSGTVGTSGSYRQLDHSRILGKSGERIVNWNSRIRDEESELPLEKGFESALLAANYGEAG